MLYPVPPGWAVGLLGLVAVWMAATNMSRHEKAFWFLISTALFFAEIRDIGKDRLDRDEIDNYARRMDQVRFGKILKQEQQTFQATSSLSQTMSSLSNVRQEYQKHIGVVAKAPEDLKSNALRLSLNILEFLADRQRHDPQLNLSSGGYGSGPYGISAEPGGDNATQYMKDTRLLFLHQFGGQLQTIRDELASKGLNDLALDHIANSTVDTWIGDSNRMIRIAADAIRKLASLVVPDDVYAGFSNARLGAIALEDAEKMEAMVTETISTMRQRGEGDTARLMFFQSFQDCCRDNLKNIRGAIVNRMGSQVVNPTETRHFIAVMDNEESPTNELGAVEEYARDLRELGDKIKALP